MNCRTTNVQDYSDLADKIIDLLGVGPGSDSEHAELLKLLRQFVADKVAEIEPRPELVYLIENQGNSPGKIMAVAATQSLADYLVSSTYDESGWVARKVVYDHTTMNQFRKDHPDFYR